MSLRRLKVDRMDLWQLHRIDPKVPRDEQFGVIADMIKEGLIRHAGLSQVTVEEIESARKVFAVATVQNRYNLVDRSSADVLMHCQSTGIGFIPWFPLASDSLARTGRSLDSLARKTNATPSQIALAWVLKRSSVMLPITGAGSLAHLEEDVRAADVRPSEEDSRTLETEALKAP